MFVPFLAKAGRMTQGRTGEATWPQHREREGEPLGATGTRVWFSLAAIECWLSICSWRWS